MQAMAKRPAVDTEEVKKTIDTLHETLSSAKELTELLGQPIDAGVDVMDEELEQEFMDTMGEEEEEKVVEKATPLPTVARPPGPADSPRPSRQ